jgi:hypothetical protein
MSTVTQRTKMAGALKMSASLPEEMFLSLKRFIEISGHSFLNALKMSKNQINELIFIF